MVYRFRCNVANLVPDRMVDSKPVEFTSIACSVCLDVVFDADELVCVQCDCTFESRNALLIAVSNVALREVIGANPG